MDFGRNSPKYTFNCEDCIKANKRKQVSRYPIRQPKKILEIIYANLCGPMQEPDFWGNKYYAVFVCGRSRFKWTFLLEKRDQVVIHFVSWKILVKNQFKTKIKILHTNGGGKFLSKEFQEWLLAQGIQHVTTPAYSPEMNGACEVWNRVMVQTASAMLRMADMPLCLWGQAVLCATYLLHRSPTKGLKLLQTPFEVLYGQVPYIGYIRTWGCCAYAHIKKEQKRKKWDPHSKECILMGYTESENLFQLYDINANSIIKICDVMFFKDTLGHRKFKRLVKLPAGKNIRGQLLDDDTDSEKEDEIVEMVQPDAEQRANFMQSLLKLIAQNSNAGSMAPGRMFLADTMAPMSRSDLSGSTADTTSGQEEVIFNFKLPILYKAAMKTAHASEWRRACDIEVDALPANNTWMDPSSSDPPDNGNPFLNGCLM